MAPKKAVKAVKAMAVTKADVKTKKSNPLPVKKISDKKADFKPGQKYAMPLKTDALYLFYTSCLRQKKNKSPMAEKWCLEHGVFTLDKAKRLDACIQLEKLTIGKKKK